MKIYIGSSKKATTCDELIQASRYIDRGSDLYPDEYQIEYIENIFEEVFTKKHVAYREGRSWFVNIEESELKTILTRLENAMPDQDENEKILLGVYENKIAFYRVLRGYNDYSTETVVGLWMRI